MKQEKTPGIKLRLKTTAGGHACDPDTKEGTLPVLFHSQERSSVVHEAETAEMTFQKTPFAP
jgi:hypothetical protein